MRSGAHKLREQNGLLLREERDDAASGAHSGDRMSDTCKTLNLWKTSSSVRGVAILGVVICHSAFFGVLWYRAILNQLGQPFAPSGLPLAMAMPGWTMLQEVTRVPVPLFVLVCGQFSTFMPRTWSATWMQVRKILMPYAFWSLAGWALSWSGDATGWSVSVFLRKFLLGETQAGYYFIPIIIQYYFLIRWAVPWVKKSPRASIIVAAVLQFGWIGFNYLAYAIRGGLIPFPVQPDTLPEVPFPRFALFFVLGIWIGAYPDRMKSLLSRIGGALPWLVLLFGAAIFVEHGFILHSTLKSSPDLVTWKILTAMEQWKLSTTLFCLAVAFLLYRHGQSRILSAKWLTSLSSWTMVIFILNGPLMSAALWLLKPLAVAPAYHSLVFVSLLCISVGVPVALGSLIRKSLPWARIIVGDGR